MPKRRIYIAGPMRGIPNFNFSAFDAAAQRFRADGWDVISPAEMDRENGLDETAHPKGADVFDFEETRQFIWRDFLALVGSLRAENGDAIALLPGWQNSVGARAEFALAQWAKLEIRCGRTTYPLRVDFDPPNCTVQYPLLDAGCDPELGCGIDPAGTVIHAAEAVANMPEAQYRGPDGRFIRDGMDMAHSILASRDSLR